MSARYAKHAATPRGARIRKIDSVEMAAAYLAIALAVLGIIAVLLAYFG